jgi:hypothetical protein
MLNNTENKNMRDYMEQEDRYVISRLEYKKERLLNISECKNKNKISFKYLSNSNDQQ